MRLVLVRSENGTDLCVQEGDGGPIHAIDDFFLQEVSVSAGPGQRSTASIQGTILDFLPVIERSAAATPPRQGLAQQALRQPGMMISLQKASQTTEARGGGIEREDAVPTIRAIPDSPDEEDINLHLANCSNEVAREMIEIAMKLDSSESEDLVRGMHDIARILNQCILEGAAFAEKTWADFQDVYIAMYEDENCSHFSTDLQSLIFLYPSMKDFLHLNDCAVEAERRGKSQAGIVIFVAESLRDIINMSFGPTTRIPWGLLEWGRRNALQSSHKLQVPLLGPIGR